MKTNYKPSAAKSVSFISLLSSAKLQPYNSIFAILEFGWCVCLINLLERASKALDLIKDLYTAKQEHIEECLKKVDERKSALFQLVEKACDIMQQIIRDPKFDPNKAAEFNSIVRQANEIMKTCKEFLSEAEKTIDELTEIMSTMKWLSRFLRLGGWLLTGYVLYHAGLTSTVNSLLSYIPSSFPTLINDHKGNVGPALLTTVWLSSGFAWLLWFPSKAYAFRDNLEKLKKKHKRLTIELQEVDRRLVTGVENMEENKKSKLQSNREDSL